MNAVFFDRINKIIFILIILFILSKNEHLKSRESWFRPRSLQKNHLLGSLKITHLNFVELKSRSKSIGIEHNIVLSLRMILVHKDQTFAAG